MSDMPDDQKLYAVELRQMGVAVPERVPDCAWVPRSSVRVTPGAVSGDGNVARVTLNIEFTQPFEWIEVNLVI